MFYTIAGSINTFFIFFSLFGVFSQLRKIWIRKNNDSIGSSTEILSLNQFSVSYFTYLSFFVYGYSIIPFNHFITWPRLIASAIVLLILREIYLDRRNKISLVTLGITSVAFIISIIGLFIFNHVSDNSKLISTSIIVIVTIFLAQGYYHQIKLIIDSGKTGAVDLRMSQFILLMDISTIIFAIAMGLELGWPLLILAITSGTTKVIIMYLFRWVRTSARAKKKLSLKL